MGGPYIDCVSNKIKRNIGAIKRISNLSSKEVPCIKLSSSRILGTATLCGDTLLKRLQALQNRAARVISFKKYDNTYHERL